MFAPWLPEQVSPVTRGTQRANHEFASGDCLIGEKPDPNSVCFVAWLRGRLVAGGTVSLPQPKTPGRECAPQHYLADPDAGPQP